MQISLMSPVIRAGWFLHRCFRIIILANLLCFSLDVLQTRTHKQTPAQVDAINTPALFVPPSCN